MNKMSKMHKRVIAAHGALLALSALPVGAALAQTAQTDQAPQAAQLQTVTVTAQRRAENIKDVPVSVSTIKGEKLDVLVSGGDDIRLLAAKVPSLNIESSNGRTFPRFYIRGYGNTDFSEFASQPVSLVYDDIVQENPILKGFPMFDLAGVEVLRGPQGTLFGRNTPAGVVKFDSEKPNFKKVEGYYNVSAGTHGTESVEGAVNVPLSNEWAMRVSTLRQRRNDYVTNYADVAKTNQTDDLDGYNEHAERVQFLYKPNNSIFSALFNVHQRTTTGSARLFRANLIQKGTDDFAPGTDLNSIVTNALNTQSLKTNGANIRLTWDFDAFKLYSITGYEHIANYFSRGDIDGGVPTTPGNPGGPGFIPFQVQTGGFINGLEQYSQEFRVESKNTGPFNWQAGVYYFDEDVAAGQNNYNDAQQQTSHLVSEQKNRAYAAFASATYNLTDAWSVRGGVRYTDDKKDFNTLVHDNVVLVGPNGVSESKNKVSWDASTTYKLNNDVSLYARVATGFRAPSIAAASASVPITVANAETITSYEGGIKADLLDRRARVAFSLYDYRIKDQQLTVVGGTSNVTKLINAAKTDGRGAELELEGIVTPALHLNASASYNFTQINDPSLYVTKCGACTITDPVGANGLVSINGNPLPQAPKWIVDASARYGIPVGDGEFFVLTDWSWRSRVNFFLYEATEFVGKPLTEGGLRVGYNWGDGKYELAAFGRNILDQRRITGAIDFNNLTGFTNEPRVWGVQFKGNF
jgi:iron complex outermembrane receptor protein